MKVVICGGGIIGASSAYHLAKKGVRATVVERCHPACAASGKAGGFLAKHWCDDYDLGPLARKSFDMHMEMAQDPRFSDCDYRRLDTFSVAIKEGNEKKSQPVIPSWLDGSVVRTSKLGSTEDTAQVHPFKLTNAMLSAAKEMAGTDVQKAKVEDVVVENGKVTGVKTDQGVIPADVVLVTMGPWSNTLCRTLKFTPVSGQRAHSIIMRPSRDVTPHALFVSYKPRRGRDRSPEIYPRPDGTVYMCGEGDRVPLPDCPTDVTPNQESCSKLKQMTEEISSNLAEAEVEESQACYLPTSQTGLPLIGKIPGVEGAFMATGHSCWGILNAPGTGAAMAELIVDGKCTMVDLTPFDPGRLG